MKPFSTFKQLSSIKVRVLYILSNETFFSPDPTRVGAAKSLTRLSVLQNSNFSR